MGCVNRLVVGLANDDAESLTNLYDKADKAAARVVPLAVRCPVVRLNLLDDAGSHEPSRRVTLPIGREAIWRQSGQDRNLHDGPTVRTVEMVPIRGSTNVAAIGYDPATMELRVRFWSRGALYSYRNVTPGEHAAFMATPSKGQYVQWVLRRRHIGHRIAG